MKTSKLFFLSLIATVFLSGCSEEEQEDNGLDNPTEEVTDLRVLLNVPEHFNLPYIPETNIPTSAKIDLGRHLFYDTKLSANETQSCGSCHFQELAFSDDKITPTGSTGSLLVRNSQGLGNSAYHSTLTWASDGLLELEDQLKVPLMGSEPIELGVTASVTEEVLARFDRDPAYVKKFSAAFPDAPNGASLKKIIHALASFCRSLTSGNSPYDQFLNGDFTTLTDQQIRGFELFHGERFECFHCHDGPHFSASYRDEKSQLDTQTYPFFNNGLYNVNGENKYPIEDQGLYQLTQKNQHQGLFRPPSLRNISVTAPYMHDGSIATLREVVEHYVRGGTTTKVGINSGDGRLNVYKSEFVRPFEASDEEIDAVVAFLESLTDQNFLTDPKFSDPFNK